MLANFTRDNVCKFTCLLSPFKSLDTFDSHLILCSKSFDKIFLGGHTVYAFSSDRHSFYIYVFPLFNNTMRVLW